jgi:hypothetical protein
MQRECLKQLSPMGQETAIAAWLNQPCDNNESIDGTILNEDLCICAPTGIEIVTHKSIVTQRPQNTPGPTSNNRTTGLCYPFLGNGSVNTLPRRCNGVIARVGSCHVTCVFCRQQPARQWTGWVAVTWHVFYVKRIRAAST